MAFVQDGASRSDWYGSEGPSAFSSPGVVQDVTRAWSPLTSRRLNVSVVPSRTYGQRGLPVAVITDSCAGSPRSQRVSGNLDGPLDTSDVVAFAKSFSEWRPPSWLRLLAGGSLGALHSFGGVPDVWCSAQSITDARKCKTDNPDKPVFLQIDDSKSFHSLHGCGFLPRPDNSTADGEMNVAFDVHARLLQLAMEFAPDGMVVDLSIGLSMARHFSHPDRVQSEIRRLGDRFSLALSSSSGGAVAVSTSSLSTGVPGRFPHEPSGVELHGSVPLVHAGIEGSAVAKLISYERLRSGTPKRLGSLRSVRSSEGASSKVAVPRQTTLLVDVDPATGSTTRHSGIYSHTHDDDDYHDHGHIHTSHDDDLWLFSLLFVPFFIVCASVTFYRSSS